MLNFEFYFFVTNSFGVFLIALFWPCCHFPHHLTHKQRVTIAEFHLHCLTKRMTYNKFFGVNTPCKPFPDFFGTSHKFFRNRKLWWWSRIRKRRMKQMKGNTVFLIFDFKAFIKRKINFYVFFDTFRLTYLSPIHNHSLLWANHSFYFQSSTVFFTQRVNGEYIASFLFVRLWYNLP